MIIQNIYNFFTKKQKVKNMLSIQSLYDVDSLIESISEEISTFANLIEGLQSLESICDPYEIEQIEIILKDLEKNQRYFKYLFYYIRDFNKIIYESKFNLIVGKVQKILQFNQIVFDYLNDNHKIHLETFFTKVKIEVN